ncbi:MAG: calcium-binding protein [Pseudomonadota bacterium]
MSDLTLFQLIFGSFKGDDITGSDGKDIAFGLSGDDKISGGAEADSLFGGFGADIVIGNTGNDRMFGGAGDDLLVWNNGDGSDLMNGGDGVDRQQVNFDTDLVNTDLQNDDVAAFTTTEEGIQFARIEVNGQTERGLFQLDIRETEVQETNFGGGNDTAIIGDGVLDAIRLQLDGGEGVDTLDFSGILSNISVNLDTGAFIDKVFFANGVLGPEDLEGLDLGPAVETSTAIGFENVIGTAGGDQIIGNDADNVISGGNGDDRILGGNGDDTLIGNKGSDTVEGGAGDDTIIWNNGDGSDLFDGGADEDRVQVNFDTDLVNTDLQNKDVATFATTADGVQFARVELNDQSVNGLFQLDIRNTETLETNFGGGDDTAVLEGNVLNAITLDLDGGAGVDTLDVGAASGPVSVDLATGVIEIDNGAGPDGFAINFENVTGTDSNDILTGNDADNVIRGGSGDDTMRGGEGADTFLFFQEDVGTDVILDFEIGIDQLAFVTNDPDVTEANLLAGLTQAGDDVELALNNKLITFEDVEVADFSADMFLIA